MLVQLAYMRKLIARVAEIRADSNKESLEGWLYQKVRSRIRGATCAVLMTPWRRAAITSVRAAES
jgi:hypothetical protein